MYHEKQKPWTQQYLLWGAIPFFAFTLYNALAHLEATLVTIALFLILVTAVGLGLGMALGEYVHRRDD